MLQCGSVCCGVLQCVAVDMCDLMSLAVCIARINACVVIVAHSKKGAAT